MLKLTPETCFKKTEIGEIPKDWEVITLGNNSNIEIIMGQSPSSKYYNQDRKGIPFIQGKTEFDELFVNPVVYTQKCHKIAPAWSVLITVRAPVGEVNITKEKLCIGRGVAAIFDKTQDLILNRFIYYMLKGLREYISSVGDRGTTYEAITKEEIENFPIPYPPPPEQSRIAQVLSWFDDLIENKKKQNEILEKTAMAIFKNWFIDFEPFKNQKFVDSELGRIPEGWKVELLKNVTKRIFSGRGRYIIESEKGEYPLWGANGILGYINEYDLEGFAVLTGRVGTLGKVFLVQNKFAISDNVLAVISLKEHYTFFIYLWLKTQIDFESLNVGSTQPLITKTALGNEKILLPSDSLLQQFHSLVHPLFHKIILNQKQIMLLRKIRNTLLPLLVFGKLRVREV
jgi:type I restriction enzyme S subunit